MANVLRVSDLPGGEIASRFEGVDHGAGASFFVTHCPPGAGPGLHHHPYEETFIVQGGEVRFTVDGEELHAGPGEIVVVPAGAVHRFVNSGEETLDMVSVHPRNRMEQTWVEE